MESNTIKSIVPYICPHCSKDFFVELTTIPTMVTGIITPADIERAKQEALDKIKALDVDPDSKVDVIKWIEDDETIFGPSDVDKIIENLR